MLTVTEQETIRKLVIKGNSSNIRSLLLTVSQINLFNKVKKSKTKFITSSILSNEIGISVQNANAKLIRLYQAGYLDRIETSSDSGGIEHLYLKLGEGIV